MKLKELADKLGASLDPPNVEAEITGVGSIDSAAPGQVTFIATSKYASMAATTRASALIVDDNFPAADKPLLRIKNTQYAYARAVELLHKPQQEKRGIHATAVIDPSARIGADVSIGAYVVIGAAVEIGEGCTLLPHVVIYRGVKIGRNFFAHSHVSIREYCEIGNNVLLHNGAIIG
ncbi:MAG: LpxD N-terminal domain-containing protein, partial [Candidatus Angelobacter sp.]